MDIHEKMERLNVIAYNDTEYRELMGKMRVFENILDKVEHDLTLDQRNVVWDFWGLSSEIEQRKLELACEHMEFRE